MKVMEAFEKLVAGEIESFIVRDRGDFQIFIDMPTMDSNVVKYYGLKPATEEVEVRRWAIVDEKGNACGVFGDISAAERACLGNPQIIELTGHYTRPIPKKIKKRVEVSAAFDGANFYLNGTRSIPIGAKIFAEYEEEV